MRIQLVVKYLTLNAPMRLGTRDMRLGTWSQIRLGTWSQIRIGNILTAINVDIIIGDEVN